MWTGFGYPYRETVETWTAFIFGIFGPFELSTNIVCPIKVRIWVHYEFIWPIDTLPIETSPDPLSVHSFAYTEYLILGNLI